jgi:hypothetical protein
MDDTDPASPPLRSTVPSPSPELLAAVASMRPVSPRVPVLTTLWLGLCGMVLPAARLALGSLRPDLDSLPRIWLGSMLALWLGCVLFPLGSATLPARGQVTPDGRRAGRAAFRTSVLSVVAGLAFPLHPATNLAGRIAAGIPGVATTGFLLSSVRGLLLALVVAAPLIVCGLWRLRRLAVVDLGRLGSAFGAAGGALGAITSFLTCPDPGAFHAGLIHGGGVVAAALAGFLAGAWLARRCRARPRPRRNRQPAAEHPSSNASSSALHTRNSVRPPA